MRSLQESRNIIDTPIGVENSTYDLVGYDSHPTDRRNPSDVVLLPQQPVTSPATPGDHDPARVGNPGSDERDSAPAGQPVQR